MTTNTNTTTTANTTTATETAAARLAAIKARRAESLARDRRASELATIDRRARETAAAKTRAYLAAAPADEIIELAERAELAARDRAELAAARVKVPRSYIQSTAEKIVYTHARTLHARTGNAIYSEIMTDILRADRDNDRNPLTADILQEVARGIIATAEYRGKDARAALDAAELAARDYYRADRADRADRRAVYDAAASSADELIKLSYNKACNAIDRMIKRDNRHLDRAARDRAAERADKHVNELRAAAAPAEEIAAAEEIARRAARRAESTPINISLDELNERAELADRAFDAADHERAELADRAAAETDTSRRAELAAAARDLADRAAAADDFATAARAALDTADRLLSEIKPNQHKVYKMRFIDGMTLEQVADKLGITKQAVSKQCKKIIVTLEKSETARAALDAADRAERERETLTDRERAELAELADRAAARANWQWWTGERMTYTADEYRAAAAETAAYAAARAERIAARQKINALASAYFRPYIYGTINAAERDRARAELAAARLDALTAAERREILRAATLRRAELAAIWAHKTELAAALDFDNE